MSIKRILQKVSPVLAARKAHKQGQNPIKAFFDPQGLILKQKDTPEMIANQKKKREYERTVKAYEAAGRTPPPMGMKHGGKVKDCCRGMGKATSGGYFSHD